MYMQRIGAILRAAEGGEPGGGGGGGGNDPPSKAEPPKVLTEEDIGRIANAAITSQLKRLNLEGKITEAVGGLKLDEKLSSFAETIKASLQAPKEPKQGDTKPVVDPEIARQLQKLNDDFEKERTARVAAQAEAENIKRAHEFGAARQKLYESLKPHASETLHDVWVDYMIHHGRLKVEDGKPLLEVEYAPAKGLPKHKEFLPLEEALPHLIATEEAKRFLPVPDAENGRGSPAPRNGRRSQGSPSLDSADPMERVFARLEKLGIDPNSEFT